MRIIPFYGSCAPPSSSSAAAAATTSTSHSVHSDGIATFLMERTSKADESPSPRLHKIVFSHATSLCNNFHFGACFDLQPLSVCEASGPLAPPHPRHLAIIFGPKLPPCGVRRAALKFSEIMKSAETESGRQVCFFIFC